MDAYFLSVTAAAVICAIAMHLSGSKGAIGRIIRLVCGLVMAAVIARPLKNPVLPDYTGYFRDLEAQITAVVNAGTEDARAELSRHIIRETEAYIFEKARNFGADLEISVILDDGDPPVPAGVMLQGVVTDDIRSKLTQVIEEDLGIGKEDQIWKEQTGNRS